MWPVAACRTATLRAEAFAITKNGKLILPQERAVWKGVGVGGVGATHIEKSAAKAVPRIDHLK